MCLNEVWEAKNSVVIYFNERKYEPKLTVMYGHLSKPRGSPKSKNPDLSSSVIATGLVAYLHMTVSIVNQTTTHIYRRLPKTTPMSRDQDDRRQVQGRLSDTFKYIQPYTVGA